MKLLRRKEGYSYYENPDKELVKKIKNFPKPTTVRNVDYDELKEWTFKSKNPKGRYIMESSEGDIQTIDKEEFEEKIKTAHLQNINAKFLVSDTFNKYFAPFYNGGQIVKMTDKHLGLFSPLKNFYEGVSGIFLLETYNAYKWERYSDGYKGKAYYNFNFSLEKGIELGHMHFNEDGEIMNRNYNYNFNRPKKFVTFEKEKENFLKFFDKKQFPNKLMFYNDKWFTDKFVLDFNIIKNDDSGFKIEVQQIPKLGKNSYYYPGESNIKINIPKKDGPIVIYKHIQEFMSDKFKELEKNVVQEPEECF